MTEKAEALRCRRYESIVNERYDFFDREKEKGNFLAWFKKKADARNTKWQNVYKHFETFCEGKCTFGEIDVDLCNKFFEPSGKAERSRFTIDNGNIVWGKNWDLIFPVEHLYSGRI